VSWLARVSWLGAAKRCEKYLNSIANVMANYIWFKNGQQWEIWSCCDRGVCLERSRFTVEFALALKLELRSPSRTRCSRAQCVFGIPGTRKESMIPPFGKAKKASGFWLPFAVQFAELPHPNPNTRLKILEPISHYHTTKSTARKVRRFLSTKPCVSEVVDSQTAPE